MLARWLLGRRSLAGFGAGIALGLAACGERPEPDLDVACRPADERTVPGPSDLVAAMRTTVRGRGVRERLRVRPDGAVRLERPGDEPVCYRAGVPAMRELRAGLEGFERLRPSYGPRPADPGDTERAVSSQAHSVRSVDGASRPRALERTVVALRRIAELSPPGG